MANERDSDFPVSFRVLLVTSDENCAENATSVLRQCNFQVTRTSLGAQAIKLLREDENKFDFVICDEHVADVDAIKLIGIISFRMHVHTAYLYSGTDYKILERITGLDVSLYYTKPVKIEDVKSISNYLLWHMRIKHDDVRIDEKEEEKEKDSCDDGFDAFEMMPKDDFWPVEVHEKFVAAVKALPKHASYRAIMDHMNVEGLSEVDVRAQRVRYLWQLSSPNRIIPPASRLKVKEIMERRYSFN